MICFNMGSQSLRVFSSFATIRACLFNTEVRLHMSLNVSFALLCLVANRATPDPVALPVHILAHGEGNLLLKGCNISSQTTAHFISLSRTSETLVVLLPVVSFDMASEGFSVFCTLSTERTVLFDTEVDLCMPQHVTPLLASFKTH